MTFSVDQMLILTLAIGPLNKVGRASDIHLEIDQIPSL